MSRASHAVSQEPKLRLGLTGCLAASPFACSPILPTLSPLQWLTRTVDPANGINKMPRNALVDDLPVHQLELFADPRPNVSIESEARRMTPIMQRGIGCRPYIFRFHILIVFL